jgi:hypothetical protein
MAMKSNRWFLAGILCLSFCVLGSTGAWASHYRLEYLSFLDPAQVASYAAVGIEGTETFLQRTLTAEARQELSAQTGISELEILVLARLSELLQIEGVGPAAAQLIRAAGVESLDDLLTRDPATLTEQLIAVNAVEHLTGVDPAIENVSAWIEAAGSVPYRVE